MPDNPHIHEVLAERLANLPSVVREAITSAKVEDHLRKLSEQHKLHLDQWEKLENEVMMALLGFEAANELEQNIQREVDVAPDMAHTLAQAINQGVFEPIRKELERGLEHPEAETKEKTDAERLREQLLSGQKQAPAPATPPPPLPTHTVARGPASGAYKPGEPSSARKIVADDPYREPPK